MGHAAPVPSHAYGAQRGTPVERAARSVHLPAGAVHVSHGPLHADSQHTPSVQNPLAQSDGRTHVCAVFVRHSPAVSQTFSPVHVSVSSAPVTAEHLPGVAVHV